VERTDVNPWEWSKGFGFSQAVSLTGAERLVFISGQTAIGPDGMPPATDDMRAQVTAAMESLRTVLEAASLSFADLVRVVVYTTDMDEFLGVYESVRATLATNLPTVTLLGVSRLAYPQLKVEIEATAVA
jgi:enamine deaminase RidA (YjgF/YER057c/UK114 family)